MKVKRPQQFEFCCVICSERQIIETVSKRAAETMVRREHGYSLSKHGWLCNWHTGWFTENAASQLVRMFDLYSDLRPRREYVFYGNQEDGKDWRFDFAFPRYKVAIEVDGGEFSNGRHTRGSGFTKDCEKLNYAAMNGWRVMRYTPRMLKADPLGVIKQIEMTIGMEQP